jgi:hypothetical protein
MILADKQMQSLKKIIVSAVDRTGMKVKRKEMEVK